MKNHTQSTNDPLVKRLLCVCVGGLKSHFIFSRRLILQSNKNVPVNSTRTFTTNSTDWLANTDVEKGLFKNISVPVIVIIKETFETKKSFFFKENGGVDSWESGQCAYARNGNRFSGYARLKFIKIDKKSFYIQYFVFLSSALYNLLLYHQQKCFIFTMYHTNGKYIITKESQFKLWNEQRTGLDYALSK